MRILVTGASGFVGSLLIGALARDGHALRAFGREPERIQLALEPILASPGAARGASAELPRTLQLAAGDAVSGAGLQEALEGIEVAYYLIHSMERSADRAEFDERERRAAANFAAASIAAGVNRIVYLGGLVPHWEGTRDARSTSRHLVSRLAVERTLLEALPSSLALRASIVIGARSRSFRLLVRLVERMPVVPLPGWQRFRTQPIDARDVIAMLVASADLEGPRGALDIAGPDTLSYGEIVRRIAELMLLGRPSVTLRPTIRTISGLLAAAIAGEDPELVSALMEGLKGDLLVADPAAAATLLDVRLHSFDSAVGHALAEWESSEPLAGR